MIAADEEAAAAVGNSLSNSARMASSPLSMVILSKWPMNFIVGCSSRKEAMSTPACLSRGRIPCSPASANQCAGTAMSPSESTMGMMPCWRRAADQQGHTIGLFGQSSRQRYER